MTPVLYWLILSLVLFIVFFFLCAGIVLLVVGIKCRKRNFGKPMYITGSVLLGVSLVLVILLIVDAFVWHSSEKYSLKHYKYEISYSQVDDVPGAVADIDYSDTECTLYPTTETTLEISYTSYENVLEVRYDEMAGVKGDTTYSFTSLGDDTSFSVYRYSAAYLDGTPFTDSELYKSQWKKIKPSLIPLDDSDAGTTYCLDIDIVATSEFASKAYPDDAMLFDGNSLVSLGSLAPTGEYYCEVTLSEEDDMFVNNQFYLAF